jgi:bla regulator protein blaR1
MILAAIGWLVVHSLWQWTLIAGVVVLLLSLVPDRAARVRYRIAYAGLGSMVLISAVTLVTAYSRGPSPVPRSMVYAFNGALIIPVVAPWGATLLQTAAVTWLVAVGWHLIGLTMEWRRARVLRDRGLRAPASSARAAFRELCDRMAISRPVELHESAQIHVPMLIGWRRPAVLLPVRVAQQLTADRVRAVLAHELAHVRRRDYAMNLWQLAADTVVIHHPAARWLSRRVRLEREYSCDDEAIALTADAASYAAALADLEDARSAHALPLAAASGTLLDRIQRVVGAPRPTLTAVRGLIACAVAVVLAAATLVAAVNVPPPWLPSGVRMRRPPPAMIAPSPGPPVDRR